MVPEYHLNSVAVETMLVQHSATRQQKALSGPSALRSHPGGRHAGGSGSAKKRIANEVVSPRADLQFAGEGMVFAEVMDVL